MQPLPTTQTPRTKAGHASGPPRLFWIAQAIAAVVLGAPLIAYGIYCLKNGVFFIPYGYRYGVHGLRMEHGAALLAAWACVIGGVGVAIRAGLTSIDRIKHAATAVARFAGAVALLLFVAALGAHLIG